MKIDLEVLNTYYGHAVILNGYLIKGPSPVGTTSTVYKCKVDVDDVEKALKNGTSCIKESGRKKDE
jgi:hypothetical protein